MMDGILLSICIATYRRADYLEETLRSIAPQVGPGVEIVLVDGASPDETPTIMRRLTEEFPCIRYIREDKNSGVDADYDKAVRYAAGEYCWLMTDDDLLVSDAVSKVVDLLQSRPALLVLDASVENVDFSRQLLPRRLAFSGLRRYRPEDRDAMLADIGEAISFIGAVVIRRDIWLARDHARYAGTAFAHVGVILQGPLPGEVVAFGGPLIRIRLGNAMWTPRRFEIWAITWPELVWAMPDFSDWARLRLGAREPWRSFSHLFSFRAKGAYSWSTYREHFAQRRVGPWRFVMLALLLLPGRWAHVMGTAYMRVTGQLGSNRGYDLLHGSPHANPVSRWIAAL